MKKLVLCLFATAFVLFLGGCGVTGEKTASLSIVYAIAALCALVVFIAYFLLISKKDKWSMLLFTSVIVVNVGYFLLSTADTLDVALWANRIAYFGSVFLPLSMFMIIVRVTNINVCKWVQIVLFVLSAIVFFIAASPGYLDIYYKEVTLEIVGGVTVLDKVYGPLHVIYLFYLLGYFAAMIAAITYATLKKRIESNYHAIIFALAVFANIGIWFFGQVVSFDFEFLSVSYIITELFILCLYLLMQETERRNKALVSEQINPQESTGLEEKLYSDVTVATFKNGISLLTATEKKVYDIYAEGKSTRDAMTALGITENTLKYHNRNIYGKLGVANKKRMLEILAYIEKNSSEE
jgi:DNA-binding CsgD family transcriptional regulator